MWLPSKLPASTSTLSLGAVPLLLTKEATLLPNREDKVKPLKEQQPPPPGRRQGKARQPRGEPPPQSRADRPRQRRQRARQLLSKAGRPRQRKQVLLLLRRELKAKLLLREPMLLPSKALRPRRSRAREPQLQLRRKERQLATEVLSRSEYSDLISVYGYQTRYSYRL